MIYTVRGGQFILSDNGPRHISGRGGSYSVNLFLAVKQTSLFLEFHLISLQTFSLKPVAAIPIPVRNLTQGILSPLHCFNQASTCVLSRSKSMSR